MSVRSFSAIVIAAVILPGPTSLAQTGNDPSAGSPPGTIYELPVDKGRADAAPGRGSAGGEDAGPLGEGSFYRSENNFGTSAVVPGDPKARGAAPGEDPGAPAAAGGTESTSSNSSPGGASESGAIALLALLAAGGVGIGFVSRRSWA